MQLDLLAHVRDALRDRYLVEAEIGRGGMALVCRGRDLRHDRPVAIKILYPDLARAVGGERFLREIAILARLSHPNILPLLDSGSFEIASGLQVPWYVMPLVTEDTLRGRLSREGPLPVEQALELADGVAAALVHAHAGGFIHRDIKPENILLSGGEAMLADFGIARALTVASGGTLSSTGIVVGTPAYMSPEQSAGSAQLDGRTDLYSLGIVLYEMLAGHPPFSGNTPQALSARHQFETPPPIRVVRPTVPEGVARLLTRMLAKIPGDRLASAEELRQALKRLRADGPGEAEGQPPVRVKRRALVGVLAILVVGAGSAVAHRLVSLGRIDAERVVVLPFQHVGDVAPALIRGVDCAILIDDALARWPDLPKVDGLRVQSAIAAAGPPHTLQEGERLARGLGAGRLIWGQVFQAGDSIRVRAFLYQLGWLGSRTTAEYSIGLPAGAGIAADPALARVILESFMSLARQLMARAAGSGPDPAESLETTSYAALRAKLSGDSALGAWDLGLARRRFREAIGLDPGYPQAQLALAQLGSWFDEPVGEWRTHATAALSHASRLSGRQGQLARALTALAEDRYPEACAIYQGLIAADSTDFAAWFGLGECLAKDPVVVRSVASPSGYAFRGGYGSAIQAYLRAMELVPLSHLAFTGPAITRLLDRFFAEPHRFRLGRAGPDEWFAAFPQRQADSLAFVPRPIQGVLDGHWPDEHPGDAVAVGQRALLGLTRHWLGAIPHSQAAWRARAIALELSGEVVGAGDPAASALAAIVRARKLAGPGEGSLELRATHVRLLLKSNQFAAAAALADSLLSQVIPADDEEGRILSGLAALRGRVGRAANLARAAAGTEEIHASTGTLLKATPVELQDHAALLVFASFGVPPDSIERTATRLRASVAGRLPPAAAMEAFTALTDRATIHGFPFLGAPTGAGHFRTVEQAIDRGDGAAARQVLDSLALLRRPYRPGDAGLDGIVLEARLRLMLADSAGAREALQQIFTSLVTTGRDLVGDVPQAVAVGSGLRLLGVLVTGPEGERWRSASRAIWSGADSALGR